MMMVVTKERVGKRGGENRRRIEGREIGATERMKSS